jgi:molybdenum cofactor cytidylyltransferase
MSHTQQIESVPRAAALILAAGAATRMGSLKQLMPFARGTLLTNVIEQTRQAGFDRIIVVVGAHADRIRPALAHFDVEIALNPDWETGMGASIHAGLRHFQENGETADVLGIFLSDQAYVLASHLISMRTQLAESDASIVAAEYGGGYGVPALFRKLVFPLLAALPPEAGAKQLLRGAQLKVLGFPLPEAEMDIDTPADFAALEAVRT